MNKTKYAENGYVTIINIHNIVLQKKNSKRIEKERIVSVFHLCLCCDDILCFYPCSTTLIVQLYVWLLL